MDFTLEDHKVAIEGNFPYTTDYVAKYVNHPKITGRATLRNFLRAEGLMVRNYPAHFSISNGYMKVMQFYSRSGLIYEKVMISPTGLDYIDELVVNKLGITRAEKKYQQKR